MPVTATAYAPNSGQCPVPLRLQSGICVYAYHTFNIVLRKPDDFVMVFVDDDTESTESTVGNMVGLMYGHLNYEPTVSRNERFSRATVLVATARFDAADLHEAVLAYRDAFEIRRIVYRCDADHLVIADRAGIDTFVPLATVWRHIRELGVRPDLFAVPAGDATPQMIAEALVALDTTPLPYKCDRTRQCACPEHGRRDTCYVGVVRR